MSTPDIPNSLQLHAAGSVSDATPPITTGNVGLPNVVTPVTRTGAGIWVINLNEEIEALDRKTLLTVADADHGSLMLDSAVETVNTIGVLGFVDGTANAYVAGDLNWTFMVFRVAIFL